MVNHAPQNVEQYYSIFCTILSRCFVQFYPYFFINISYFILKLFSIQLSNSFFFLNKSRYSRYLWSLPSMSPWVRCWKATMPLKITFKRCNSWKMRWRHSKCRTEMRSTQCTSFRVKQTIGRLNGPRPRIRSTFYWPQSLHSCSNVPQMLLSNLFNCIRACQAPFNHHHHDNNIRQISLTTMNNEAIKIFKKSIFCVSIKSFLQKMLWPKG